MLVVLFDLVLVQVLVMMSLLSLVFKVGLDVNIAVGFDSHLGACLGEWVYVDVDVRVDVDVGVVGAFVSLVVVLCFRCCCTR